MANDAENGQEITGLLAREALWKIEDRLSVVLESIADHEAEIVRLRRLTDLLSDRISRLSQRTNHTE